MKKFFEKYDKNKLKANVKMCSTRIGLVRNKTRNNAKVQRRHVAELLMQEKDESARIKVEGVIRDDYLLEALDLLELFCELVSNRIQLITEVKTCPYDMKEAVTTLIYAAARLDSIKELREIRNQFQLKFGKEFVQAAVENKDLTVNQRVMFKLSVRVPEPALCVEYMKEIARENNIDWDDSSVLDSDQLPSSIYNDGLPNSASSGVGVGGVGPSNGNMGGSGGMGTGRSLPNSSGMQYAPPVNGGTPGYTAPVNGGMSGYTGGMMNNNGMQYSPQPPTNTGTVYQNDNRTGHTMGGSGYTIHPPPMDPSGGKMSQNRQQSVSPSPPPQTYYSSGTEAPGYSAEGFQPHGFDSSTMPESYLQQKQQQDMASNDFTTPRDNQVDDENDNDDRDDDDQDDSGFGANYDFDDLQKRFESLKNRT